MYVIRPAGNIKQIPAAALHHSAARRGSKSSYYSHELNLVLKDGERTAVVDHGNGRKLRRDAEAVAEFLSVPLWDPWAIA